MLHLVYDYAIPRRRRGVGLLAAADLQPYQHHAGYRIDHYNIVQFLSWERHNGISSLTLRPPHI
jgi:hypothetical protein